MMSTYDKKYIKFITCRYYNTCIQWLSMETDVWFVTDHWSVYSPEGAGCMAEGAAEHKLTTGQSPKGTRDLTDH